MISNFLSGRDVPIPIFPLPRTKTEFNEPAEWRPNLRLLDELPSAVQLNIISAWLFALLAFPTAINLFVLPVVIVESNAEIIRDVFVSVESPTRIRFAFNIFVRKSA